MFSKKNKITSDNFGALLFNNLILPSYSGFYNNIGSKEGDISPFKTSVTKDDVIELELLFVYVWLVNHFLNVAGEKYQKVANALNHIFFQYYKDNIPSAKLAPLNGDGFFNLLNLKCMKYKDTFMSDNKNMNFGKVAMIASSYVLASDKPNLDIFFNFKLGTSLQQSAIALAKVLKKIELVD